MTTAKDYIMALTGVTEDQYSSFFYSSAEAFLESYYCHDHEVVTLLMQCPDFWLWWACQFNQLDDAFALRFATDEAPAHILRQLWQAMHAPDAMVAYPAQHVIENALSGIWSKVWKQEHAVNHKRRVL